MTVLFTLGLYQSERPSRWAAKHKVFHYLSASLNKMGVASYFLCNQQSVKPRFVTDEYYFEHETNIVDLLQQLPIRFVVVWGGRTPGDDLLRSALDECDVQLIYAEAGWFPQSGTCYFSPYGTNANARFEQEGLREHSLDIARFNRSKLRLLRSWLGFFAGKKVSESEATTYFSADKPIFIPLQDELDSNILLSSPVKTMSAFVSKLSMTYPDYQFVVRPHPRARYDTLPILPNVSYQNVSVNPYKCFHDYGGVIGINSTMLMQFSLMGVPVLSFGQSVASGGNACIEGDFDCLPEDLTKLHFDHHQSMKFFDFLLNSKQLSVKKLKSVKYVRNSYLMTLFKE